MSRFILGLVVGGAAVYLVTWRTELLGKARQRRAAKVELDGLTKEQLYERAQKEDIPGRGSMSKDELRSALTESGESAESS
jgi:hypothetical protein